MTSFGWKRKIGENISQTASTTFKNNTKEDDDVEEIKSGEIDWLTLAPKRRAIQLEDAPSKSQRLKKEGELLADSERYWEALQKWDEAVHLTPEDEVLYELKAQAYMALNEVYPAITAAQKAVDLNQLWWVGHQTLGRAHLNLGEVRIAIKCFSRAIHLNPACEELWTEDLHWVSDLLSKKQKIDTELEKNSTVIIEEVKDSGEESKNQSLVPIRGKQGSLDTKLLHLDNTDKLSSVADIKYLPQNYVVMRD